MNVPRARAHHVVRFSTHDDDLIPALADFVSDGVRLGERVSLSLTSDHWRALEAMLGERHVRIGTALKHQQVVVSDVHEMLAAITVDGRTDVSRFKAMAAAMLEALAPPIRLFGELCPLVAARGEWEAALEMEKVGETLARDAGVNILCAYHLEGLGADPGHIAQVCASHDAAVSGGNEVPGVRPVVLLADDFNDGRELYEEYLRFKGYQVVSATDGLQAVSLARMTRPAVMLLDVRMPGMSGLEAMQILKKDASFRRVPIVALTAHALDSERAAFLANGFDAVLAKPCLPADVADTVSRLLVV